VADRQDRYVDPVRYAQYREFVRPIPVLKRGVALVIL
jgi:hypothetical protein